MDSTAWDERYAEQGLAWSAGPNALFAELTADLPPGRALDVGAGEGRTALWLAQRGWAVRAIDFSSVGIEKGRRRAAELGLDVDWVCADVTSAALGTGEFDLVAVLYLHLKTDDLTRVLARAAGAVAPGGRLVIIGHDRDNLTRGTGGPQDPDLLYTTPLLAAAALRLRIERLEQVDRPTDAGIAIDTLLVAVRD
jgi:SAM-dependent methyltransferase